MTWAMAAEAVVRVAAAIRLAIRILRILFPVFQFPNRTWPLRCLGRWVSWPLGVLAAGVLMGLPKYFFDAMSEGQSEGRLTDGRN